MKCDFQFRRQFALWMSGLTVAGAGWATQVDLWGQTAPTPSTPPAVQTFVPVGPPAPASPVLPSGTSPKPAPEVVPTPVQVAVPTPAAPPVPVATPFNNTAPALPMPQATMQAPNGATLIFGGSGDAIGVSSFQMMADQQNEAQQWNQAAAELVQKYGQTKDEKARVALGQQLTELVSKQFDRRQQFREKELKELEDKVAQLRSLHDRRTAAKSEIVRDRVKQLLRQADGLGWGGPEEEGGPTPFEARYGMGLGGKYGGGSYGGVGVDPATGMPSPDLVPSDGTAPSPDLIPNSEPVDTKVNEN